MDVAHLRRLLRRDTGPLCERSSRRKFLETLQLKERVALGLVIADGYLFDPR